MKPTDAPGMLSLTYQGWLFGHGFVEGGCAIFRNSLYAGAPEGGKLHYDIYGLLATHCKTVDEVEELTKKYGVQVGFHSVIADEKGGIVGIEAGKGGYAFLRPRKGLYTHANGVCGGPKLACHEETGDEYIANSPSRTNHLRENLEKNAGRLTPQLAWFALADHRECPRSICRHDGEQGVTTSAVVAEPTRKLLHVSRGQPCSNWPKTYTL
jgi:hypothetical protein